MGLEEGGHVYLVGAGPGDPRLATKRALDLVARADVIVYDRLVPHALLDQARAGAELVYVGKRPGGKSISQGEINELLVQRAAAGSVVVRLKGGDPFVFGRGGEEAEALAEAGIRFQIVPGVTAGIAAPAYAGIPVTHRDEASAVAFVTGHEQPEKNETALDWDALAVFPGTLVFYMGVRNIDSIANSLIEHGRAPDEPAAVIERGSLPGQRTVAGPLSAIAEIARAEGIEPPAVTVVGAVAGLRERLAWFEQAPLHGRTIVVTRARAQASSLAERLTELGGDVIEAPAIRIEPRHGDPELEAAIERVARHAYEVICLTSANGVDVLLDELLRLGLDARALAGATVAAIGPGTAAALRARGVEPDVVPEHSIAEALAAELRKRELTHKRVMVARAAEARDVLPESLREAAAEVDVVPLYDTIGEELSEEASSRIAAADYVTFTSSSTVRYLIEALGGPGRFPRGARVVSIGPVTSKTARELGLEVHAEAARHDIGGLVEALLEDALAGRLAGRR